MQQKLYRIKAHLKWWNKTTFENIKDKVKHTEQEFEASEAKFDINHYNLTRAEMK